MGFVAMQDMTGCELTFEFLSETDCGSGTEAMRLQEWGTGLGLFFVGY